MGKKAIKFSSDWKQKWFPFLKTCPNQTYFMKANVLREKNNKVRDFSFSISFAENVHIEQ